MRGSDCLCRNLSGRVSKTLRFGGLNRGSALVEAAMIVPLVILIIMGIVKMSITLTDNVEIASLEHKQQAVKITEATGARGEQVLRGKWTLDILKKE